MNQCVNTAPGGRRVVILAILAACGSVGVAQAAGLAGAGAVTGSAPVAVADVANVGDWVLLRKNALMMNAAAHTIFCYTPDVTEEQLNDIIEMTGLLPPTQQGFAIPQFFTDNTVWVGEGVTGPARQAVPANLTYSFPADGTTWGLSSVGFGTGPNALNAMLINASTIGQGNPNRLDFGRELIRQALAGWRANTGLRYTEVADDNVAMNQTSFRVATRGDIRIGGYPYGTTFGVLAYNAFPTAALAGVGGGDMAVNTSFINSFNNSGSNWRFFRNTMAHEHGHGLGAIHSVPCNSTKLMEPSIFTGSDQQLIDDIRFGQRNYGDRFAGNINAANARNFGNLTSPALRSVIERRLSTNRFNIATGTNNDWFRFTLSSAQPVTITVTPTGGIYTNGQQSSGCSGSTSSVNANEAGNLDVELRDSTGNTILFQANSQPAGQSEVITIPSLPAGEYTVRVVDVGPNLLVNQVVQLYDMTIRIASSLAPPFPIAGINKRCEANKPCFFIGNVNSRANEVGATLFTTGYDWDVDGDGIYDLLATASTNFTYVSNGTYPLTMRLTDSNGQSATDTINVVVFGATTTLDGVTPGSGSQGMVVPITITGTNLKNVVSPSEFTVSGTGVTVSGAPISNPRGTSVTGLSLTIAPGAPVGLRTISVANFDGSASLVGAFEIIAGMTPCDGDTNGDGVINFTDLNTVLSQFGQSGMGLAGDLNGDGVVNFSDLNEVLSNFGVDCN